MFKTTPASLVKQLRDLPPAPKVLHKLQRLMADPRMTMAAIADVIAMEPGLSARVVQVANSSHFNRGAKVETAMEGIQRVGLKGVQELVTFAVASQLVGRPLAAYGLGAQTLWSRAVACALAAGNLAERSGAADYDVAYTAGLMHGLGLLVLDRHVAHQKKPRVFPSSGYPLDFAPAEREWLGFSHAEVGATLLELWGFAAPVVAAVKFQLDPEAAPAEHRALCMTLATARWARSLFCVPDEVIPELPSETWLTEAGMPVGDFGEWLSRVRMRYTIACEELRLGA